MSKCKKFKPFIIVIWFSSLILRPIATIHRHDILIDFTRYSELGYPPDNLYLIYFYRPSFPWVSIFCLPCVRSFPWPACCLSPLVCPFFLLPRPLLYPPTSWFCVRGISMVMLLTDCSRETRVLHLYACHYCCSEREPNFPFRFFQRSSPSSSERTKKPLRVDT